MNDRQTFQGMSVAGLFWDISLDLDLEVMQYGGVWDGATS